MPSNSSRDPILSKSTPPGRSLLSRIKSPFNSKSRNATEFYVQPDDPHRQYSPGDIVSGSVILKLFRPVRVTHIVVCLHGYVQVYRNPNSPGDIIRKHGIGPAAGKGKRSGGYFGNGFATLFEDEVVLCGEGRLGEGMYQFNFELEFPSKGLPSSIDFERGTISYMITSTMTKPTTISPTMSCDTKIWLIEDIDIAPIVSPKPRVISLEPISRRSRAKSSAIKRVGGVSESIHKGQTTSEPSRSSRFSELSSTQEDTESPESPTPSDVSYESGVSSGNGSTLETGGPLSIMTGDSSRLGLSKGHRHKKTITATIELLKAGFLRGDNIPLKISVKHTKPVKSVRGIIVTLYRQARVDMHPALPVVTAGDGDRKMEDVYPKSRTGLGGLSLSSAGSSHLFRKDLSQSFAPLYVDPIAKTAEIKAAVRVPDEAFSTISCVPGAMITFKYHVEVVVDIQGKLQGLDKYFTNAGIMGVPSDYGNIPGMGRAEDASGSFLAAWGSNFIDTEHIRRDKSVVCCVFEVVVGTRDSERKKGKQRADLNQGTAQSHYDPYDNHVQEIQIPDYDQQYSQATPEGEPLGYGYGPAHDIAHHDYYYPNYHGANDYAQIPPEGQPLENSAYPLPQQEDEGQLTEKERLRRAEARLLPSHPPDQDTESSTSAAALAPSAPDFSPVEHTVLPLRPSAPPDNSESIAVSPYTNHIDNLLVSHGLRPSAPKYEETEQAEASSSAAKAVPTDDKAELQRRRLEMERSSPQDGQDVEASGSGTSNSFTPTAPTIRDEEEGFGFHEDASRDDPVLPKYER
ncbi:hypothetical protein M501DRAFT_1012341 [Patellaria atrata CBS 101060]|uniref:Arrestin C-terminal-like domain-containing protein n=1 Tax=Patellaria atrata CBS 101060 TaxID=1346257 RepID=A0A9P4SIM3_9PEZI|nr:hypothetical protein M501DRAFT_1012341 [Patellaria atrata CBS 101060]